jgi:hypothetical protein
MSSHTDDGFDVGLYASTACTIQAGKTHDDGEAIRI